MSERLRSFGGRGRIALVALWIVALLHPAVPRGVLAADRPVRDVGGHRRDRPDDPHRHDRAALARARVLRRGRRVRLLLLRRRGGRSARTPRAASACRRSIAMVLAVASPGWRARCTARSPGRLRGIYLGIASIGLVFIGQHILFNATGLTGGFNGRDAEPFSLAGFSFSADDPEFSVARRAVRGDRAPLVPGAPARHALVPLRAQARRRPAGAGARDRARQRGRGRGQRRRRHALQGRGVHRLVDVRRAVGRAARADLQPDRPRELRARPSASSSSR